jgi:hypothetical protein
MPFRLAGRPGLGFSAHAVIGISETLEFALFQKILVVSFPFAAFSTCLFALRSESRGLLQLGQEREQHRDS